MGYCFYPALLPDRRDFNSVINTFKQKAILLFPFVFIAYFFFLYLFFDTVCIEAGFAFFSLYLSMATDRLQCHTQKCRITTSLPDQAERTVYSVTSHGNLGSLRNDLNFPFLDRRHSTILLHLLSFSLGKTVRYSNKYL